MFEREIKFIYDFNLNKVNKLGPYFTFEQLQNADLHPAILHYISAEIDYLVFEDRQKLLKNSVFDYSGEKISYYFSLITEELKKNKRFSLEYIAKLILHATSFTVNFLVRPRWTITRFIFDEAKHKTTNEIKQILNYIYYYKYLKTIINSYINSKKILSMNLEEFDELISKTEKLSIESNFNGVISNSFIAMAEFFNIGQMQKTKIPLIAIELFLEEKNLPQHLQKITDVFGTDENASFPISDYMKIINSVIVMKDEIFEQPEEPELNFENEPNEIVELANDESTETTIVENFQNDLTNDTELTEEITSDYKDELIPQNYVDKEKNDSVNYSENEKVELTEITDSDLLKDNLEVEDYSGFTEEEIEELRDEKKSLTESEENNDEILNEPQIEQKQNYEQEQSFENSLNNELVIDYEQEQNHEQEYEKDFEHEDDTFYKQENEFDNLTEKKLFEYDEKELENETSNEISNNESPIQEKKKLELSEIIEHKDVSKIIEVIFDYDFEDFSNAIEEISNCKNVDDANLVINDILSLRKINSNSKEAESLREIIIEYFNQ